MYHKEDFDNDIPDNELILIDTPWFSVSETVGAMLCEMSLIYCRWCGRCIGRGEQEGEQVLRRVVDCRSQILCEDHCSQFSSVSRVFFFRTRVTIDGELES